MWMYSLKKGLLKNKIHVKDTKYGNYLQYECCHPSHSIKKSIPKILAKRAKKLCSEGRHLEKYIDNLVSTFTKIRYPKSC